MKDETTRWMRKAQEDLEDARVLLRNHRASAAAFHAQQAAEKALKALRLEEAGSFPKIHDPVALVRDLKPTPAVLSACETLRPAYVAFRYPDVEMSISQEDAHGLVAAGGEVVAWVLGRLS